MIRSLLSVILLATLVCLNGCDSPPSPKADLKTSTSSKKPKIALVMKSLANEFFSTMAQGAEKHQAAHSADYDLVVNGIKDERDLAGQTSIVDQMIAQGVNAIVIAPADSKALVTACRKAKEAGIAVINIDNKLDEATLKENGLQIPFVGPDNRLGAKLVGDHLAKSLQKDQEVAILEGVPTAFNAQQRKAGFEDAMKAVGAKIVDSQSAQWELKLAETTASAIITSHPNLKALLCSNDSMALGARAAVKAANKSEQILIVGFDNITAVQEAMKDGSILATADQHADQLAVFGIEYALKVLKGGSPADQQTPVDLVVAGQAK